MNIYIISFYVEGFAVTIHRFWDKECERLVEQDCPCILAEVNACPVCDYLKGYYFCNCEWAGVCVLQNYQWGEINRENKYGINILDRIYISADCLMLIVTLPPDMGNSLKEPGAWITFNSDLFKKPKDFSGFIIETFDVPGIFTVSIDVRDPEQRYWAENVRELKIKTIESKLLGKHTLGSIKNSNVIFILNEVFTPCALNLAERIDRSSNHIDSIIDRNNTFVKERLKMMGVNVFDIDVSDFNNGNIKNPKQEYDLIIFGLKDNICTNTGFLRGQISKKSLVSMFYL